jgi:hypothetical protein
MEYRQREALVEAIRNLVKALYEDCTHTSYEGWYEDEIQVIADWLIFMAKE